MNKKLIYDSEGSRCEAIFDGDLISIVQEYFVGEELETRTINLYHDEFKKLVRFVEDVIENG